MMLFDDPTLDQEEEDLRKARALISSVDPGSLDEFNRRNPSTRDVAANMVRNSPAGDLWAQKLLDMNPIRQPAPQLSDHEIAADMIRNSPAGPAMLQKFYDSTNAVVPPLPEASRAIPMMGGMQDIDAARKMISNLPAPPPMPNAEPTRIDTGFDALGNLMSGVAPTGQQMTQQMMRNLAMPVIDSFTPDTPIHTLGYSGTMGRSLPTVDYSGPMARLAAARNSFQLADLFSREDEGAANRDVRSLLAGGPMARADAAREMARNKALTLIGNAKIPSEVASSEINAMAKRGDIDPSEAKSMMLERHLSTPGQNGILQPIGPDKKSGSLFEMTKRIPADVSPEDAKKFLMDNRGVTIEDVKQRYYDLLNRGKSTGVPGTDWMIPGAWLDPSTFDRKNLNPQEREEFDAITKIFGTKGTKGTK